MSQKKDIVLSGITPSGEMTLGNYIGAVSQWREMLANYETYFMVANLHALTAYQPPKELEQRTRSFIAQLIALGIDPDRCALFLQSQVPEHAELTWVLTCLTPLGNLNRMTQFKDKSESQKSILAGLLMYPVLMAADILLYRAALVPVGADQKQHIELCRDLVEYFESKYGAGALVTPQPMIPKVGARIMSLTDPSKKMSKSDADSMSYVLITDPPETVVKKLKKSVTDSGTTIQYDESRPGIANLLTIYSALTGKKFPEIESHFQGKMFGHLKLEVADVINETLKPIQARYHELMRDPDMLDALMRKGAEKARQQASQTVSEVYRRMGILR